jgi:hypothetical protein
MQELFYSLRGIFELKSELSSYAKFLSTSVIGKTMPSIIETFGEDRNIDVNLTINHNFIQEVAGETHINPTSL